MTTSVYPMDLNLLVFIHAAYKVTFYVSLEEHPHKTLSAL